MESLDLARCLILNLHVEEEIWGPDIQKKKL